jgi:O-antigen/teichoic acid export membrane protein
MSKRIFLNIFSNWANLLILIGVKFFLTPFFIHKLGDEEYGVWILILSFIGYMEVLNLGLNTAIVRYLSKYFAVKDYKRMNEIFNTSFFLFSMIAVLIVILVFVLAFFVSDLFDFGGKMIYKIIFIIVGINFAFQFIGYALTAVLSAKQKYLEINIFGTSSFLISTVLIVIALMMGYKLFAVALIQIFSNFVRGTLVSLYSLKISPELKLNFKDIKRDAFKNLFSYNFYNLLINISTKINLSASIIIIGKFLSAEAITFYSIPNSLISYLHTLIMQMQMVLVPRFSSLEAQNKNEQIQKNLLILVRYTLILAIPIVYVFIFYGDSFIRLWLSDKYADLSGKILIILAIGKIFHISQLPTETALKGIGKLKSLSFLRITESVSALILSIILVRKYELIGIAYANAIPMVFFNLLIVPVYTCSLLKISIAKYYLKYIFKNVLAILPLFLIFQFIKFPINSYPLFGLSVLSIVVVFFILAFILILDLEEKKIIYSLLRMEK